MKELMVIVAIIAMFANATQAQMRVVIDPAATVAYKLTATCEGGSPTIKLAGSETGITYQLVAQKFNPTGFVSIGKSVKGTGKSISFPLPKHFDNNIFLVKGESTCGTLWMANSVSKSDIEKVCTKKQ